jgi:hypothetical protein
MASARRAEFYRTRRPRPPQHTDQELMRCLRRASRALRGVLTVAAYNEFAQEEDCPSSQTHINRFGSWREALVAAGLKAHPSSGVAGRGRFTPEACAKAVRRARRELAKVPTALEYEAFARDGGGRSPSLSTVRKVCGSWEEALILAGY